jgi:hypothetical protein
MIPVIPQPEPPNFDEVVRQKGLRFLRKFTTTKPTTSQWKEHAYWNKLQVEFYNAYRGICAYSAHWVPRSDNPNIDHYIPKFARPDLAYEWSNYRLACPFINGCKADFQDVLDPFTIQENWFTLDFPTLLVKPDSTLDEQKFAEIEYTIRRLKLNDDKFLDVRSNWLQGYCTGEASFNCLKRNAPFIASELERQGLIEEIKVIMKYSSLEEYA